MLITFGTGVGYSVLDMIHAFENVIRRPIPHKIVDQDKEMSKLVSLMASKSYKELNWFTQKKEYMKCVRIYVNGK
jgi:UDP-glucose 4-epimerase